MYLLVLKVAGAHMVFSVSFGEVTEEVKQIYIYCISLVIKYHKDWNRQWFVKCAVQI